MDSKDQLVYLQQVRAEQEKDAAANSEVARSQAQQASVATKTSAEGPVKEQAIVRSDAVFEMGGGK